MPLSGFWEGDGAALGRISAEIVLQGLDESCGVFFHACPEKGKLFLFHRTVFQDDFSEGEPFTGTHVAEEVQQSIMGGKSPVTFGFFAPGGEETGEDPGERFRRGPCERTCAVKPIQPHTYGEGEKEMQSCNPWVFTFGAPRGNRAIVSCSDQSDARSIGRSENDEITGPVMPWVDVPKRGVIQV